MNFLERLRLRWKVENILQVVLILIVFCCTGFTVAFLKNPVLHWLFGDLTPLWAKVLYWIFILPVYNIFLLLYGFVFGQFRFFWNFEKRLFNRIASVLKKN